MKSPNYKGLPDVLIRRLEERKARERERVSAARGFLPFANKKYAGKVLFIQNQAESTLFRRALWNPHVTHIGVDTEFRFEEGYDGDITRVVPLLLSACVSFREKGQSQQVTFVLDLRHSDLAESVSALLKCKHKLVIHYLRADYFCLRTLGFHIHNNVFDTWVAAKLLTMGRFHATEYSGSDVSEEDEVKEHLDRKRKIENAAALLAVCKRYGVPHKYSNEKDTLRQSFIEHVGPSFSQAQIEYAAEDAIATANLYEPLVLALARQDLLSHFERVEMPVAPILCEIERNGAGVDEHKRTRARHATNNACAAIKRDLLNLYGVHNPNSRKELIVVIDRVCGPEVLALFRDPFTQKLQIGKKNFERLAKWHPMIDMLYRYRRYNGMEKNQLIQGDIGSKDGRLHPLYDILGTATGRITTSRPNLNGIGRILRPLVAPEAGKGIGEVDYSQVEMAVAAAHFDDDGLIAAYNTGDIYCEIAKRFCPNEIDPADRDLPANDFKKKYRTLRDRMKPFGLGIIYNKKAPGLSVELKIPLAEAERLRNQFLDLFPKVRDGLDQVSREAKRKGYVRTITGLRRFRANSGPLASKEVNSLRNHPIQGSAADVFKMAITRIHPLLGTLNAKIIAVIYDAIVFEAPLAQMEEVAQVIQNVMAYTLQEVYPKLKAKADVNLKDTSCWNKDGHSDSIERLLQDPLYRL